MGSPAGPRGPDPCHGPSDSVFGCRLLPVAWPSLHPALRGAQKHGHPTGTPQRHGFPSCRCSPGDERLSQGPLDSPGILCKIQGLNHAPRLPGAPPQPQQRQTRSGYSKGPPGSSPFGFACGQRALQPQSDLEREPSAVEYTYQKPWERKAEERFGNGAVTVSSLNSKKSSSSKAARRARVVLSQTPSFYCPQQLTLQHQVPADSWESSGYITSGIRSHCLSQGHMRILEVSLVPANAEGASSHRIYLCISWFPLMQSSSLCVRVMGRYNLC